jgi:hypothetical protein
MAGERVDPIARGFDGVIFDLDGTLVDTLEDVADAMNRVLAREGAPGHGYDAYRYLIGHGIRNLVTEALPAELRGAERVERCYARMLEDYGAHALVKTRAYPGVPELVRALRADGVPLAIHSNKADAPTQAIVAALLDPGDFVVVAGAGRLRRRLTRRHAHGDGGGHGAPGGRVGLPLARGTGGERRARGHRRAHRPARAARLTARRGGVAGLPRRCRPAAPRPPGGRLTPGPARRPPSATRERPA